MNRLGRSLVLLGEVNRLRWLCEADRAECGRALFGEQLAAAELALDRHDWRSGFYRDTSPRPPESRVAPC